MLLIRARTTATNTGFILVDKLQILLVEDNYIERKVISMLGEKVGVAVVTASTAREALEQLSEHHAFALVLMDWQLPDMSGLECAKAIRELEGKSGRHVPIIAVTANALLGDKQKCLESGMDDYLSKPFTMQQFETTIRRWLSEESAST